MKLFHVVYGGMKNIDVAGLSDDMIDELESKIGKRFKNSITETQTLFVDHPADMENLVNTLDDLMIPCADGWNEASGVHVVVTFVLKNVDSRNAEVLEFIRKIDSTKGK